MDPVEVELQIGDTVVDALTWTMGSRWQGTDADRLSAHAEANRDAGGGPFGDAVDYVTGVAGALAEGPGVDGATRRYLSALEVRGIFG